LTLHIIGEGNEKYEEDIAFLSDSLNLKDYVKFRGKLLYEEVLKEYSNYDMLLVPSTLEAFPSIIIEAMSQGLPVIASKVGGIPEIVENEETGLLVPPGDPKKLAQAVKKLVDNPSLYEKIIRNGIKLVKKEYTNEKIIEKIENYLSNGFQQSKKKLTK